MASRKDQKEEARARRLAEERSHQERSRRTRRLRMVGGVILAAVVIVGVAIAVSSGGSGTTTALQAGPSATKTVSDVSALLDGIPQSGAQLGRSSAPVTMTYYGDLQCPACRDFTLSSFQQLVSNDVRTGKVKVVYRSFPTATRDANAFQTQQVAALAAGKQNRMWDFTELFYHQQGVEGSGYVNETFLNGIARQVPGLDQSTWQSDRKLPGLSAQVQADEQLASSQGIDQTPTLIFNGPKGRPVAASGAASYAELQKAIGDVS